MKIYCNTGDTLLDEMAEIVIRTAAESVPDCSDARLILSYRAEEAGDGERLILLYKGETAPAVFRPHCRILRTPYMIRELEEAARSLLCEERPTEGEGAVRENAVPVFDGRCVTLDGTSVTLTGKEAAVFAVLYENRGTAVSRETLCERVWGGATETNLCDVYVCRLRSALEPLFGKGCIVNIRNEGYRLVIAP